MSNHYSFKIKHPTRDLQEIADLIPLKIHRIWKKGSISNSKNNNKLNRVNDFSYCVFSFPLEINSISHAIDFLQKVPVISNEIMGSDFIKSIYCTIDGSGEVIGVYDFEKLISLQIFIEID